MADVMYYVWAKKIVDSKDPLPLEFYQKSSNYYILDMRGKAALVAFMFMLDGRPMPPHVQKCSDEEVAMLNKMHDPMGRLAHD